MTLPIKYEPQENIDEIPVNGEPDGDDVGSGNETDSDDDHDPAEVTRQLTKFRCLDAPATVNITVRDLLGEFHLSDVRRTRRLS